MWHGLSMAERFAVESASFMRSKLVGLAVGLTLVLGTPGWSDEDSALPDAAKSGDRKLIAARPKNVLFIILDATAAKHLAGWGYARQTTPIIDEFSKSGMVFLNARSQASSTLPSTASFLTGQLPPYIPKKGFYIWIRDSDYTLSEAFRARGFATGGFSENAWISAQLGFSKGFEKFKRFESNAVQADGKEKYASSKKTTDAAIRFMGSISRRPWFCYVHLLRPHYPFNAPGEFKYAYRGAEPVTVNGQLQIPGLPQKKQFPSQVAIGRYDGNLRYGDHLVGTLLSWLEKQKILDDTLVIIGSDHGEAFWEHGRKGHNLEVFEELIHIPLVIRAPTEWKFEVGESRAQVDMLDIFPTLAELYGLETKVSLPGNSLVALLKGDEGFSAKYSIATTTRLTRLSVLEGNRKGIFAVDETRRVATPEAFYELSADPFEQKNSLAANGMPGDLQHAASKFLRQTRASGNLGSEKTLLPNQQIEELKAIGYLQ
jgi:arylsulfatase A-like enzyme